MAIIAINSSGIIKTVTSSLTAKTMAAKETITHYGSSASTVVV
jgi:hypothetical protein